MIESVIPPDDSEVLTSLGARYDHLGIAVPSIAAVLPLYQGLLGGRPAAGGISPWAGHLAIQLEYPGGSRIELLEPTSASSPSIGRFLAEHPRGGLHHVTFKVDDIVAAIRQLEAAALTVVSTNLDRPEWRETFIHPRDAHGALIQIVQAGPGVPGPLTVSVPDLLAQAERLRAEEVAHRH